MPSILLVEDDPSLALSVAQGFRENGFGVTTSHSFADAEKRLAQSRFDLLVLDLGLPDGDGIDFLRRRATGREALPTVIITARGELEDRLRGLEGGADDYLVKPFAFAELLARARALLRRARPETMLRVADLNIDTLARRAVRSGADLDLTPREFDLLANLALAHGGVVTREMLARDVWRMRSWTPSMDNVIDVHISRLREKLDPAPRMKLLQTIKGVGYALKETA